jgi:RNA polymerase sigma factor (sigma-70 family)
MGAHSISIEGRSLLDRAIVKHYESLQRAMRGRGHSPGAATEIVHDLYVRLADRPQDLAGKGSLRGFLLRAAANLGIDRHRRLRLERQLFSGAEQAALQVASAGPAPDTALDVERRLAALRRAILELPARRQQVFVLHRLGGLSAEAIAHRLGLTRNMVDRHLRRALVHCLTRLAELD